VEDKTGWGGEKKGWDRTGEWGSGERKKTVKKTKTKQNHISDNPTTTAPATSGQQSTTPLSNRPRPPGAGNPLLGYAGHPLMG
jgi:hypothetical protein